MKMGTTITPPNRIIGALLAGHAQRTSLGSPSGRYGAECESSSARVHSRTGTRGDAGGDSCTCRTGAPATLRVGPGRVSLCSRISLRSWVLDSRGPTLGILGRTDRVCEL